MKAPTTPGHSHSLIPLLVALYFASCSAGVLHGGSLELQSCERQDLPKGAVCGHLRVPLDHGVPLEKGAPADHQASRDPDLPRDRAAPEQAHLELPVIILSALAEEASTVPVVYLVGGPGQAATDGAAFFRNNLRQPRQHNPIVLMDVRGTGNSSPLRCEWDTAQKLGLILGSVAPTDLAQCRQSQAVDPSHFSTREIVGDLELLRRGLGAEQVHLLGVSYGTRVAQAYAQLFPQRVRTMTLRGVAALPASAVQDLKLGAEQVLERTFAACQADEACNARFPKARAELGMVMQRLAKEPMVVSVPGGGTLRIDDAALSGALRTTLYSSRGARSIPWLVHELAEGRTQPIETVLVRRSSQMAQRLASEALLSVMCAEDLADGKAFQDLTSGPLHWRPERLASICRQWSVEVEAPIPMRKINVPTLILSGAEDPATPPWIAERAMQHLSRARHVVTPGLGHGPSWTGCFSKLFAQHLRTEDPAALDISCASEDRSAPFVLASPFG